MRQPFREACRGDNALPCQSLLQAGYGALAHAHHQRVHQLFNVTDRPLKAQFSVVFDLCGVRAERTQAYHIMGAETVALAMQVDTQWRVQRRQGVAHGDAPPGTVQYQIKLTASPG